ncbi:helix-turn-helix transcriptional regulator [Gordonia shandongensis]|uniref:helix-turn-helix transcriptional regulator n=1 Tax=Gordonia shandongensis TaxID=376351 RepID=UPI00041C7BBE|nr:helix-turn-helix domain-containing protein [Gordonia shandongensis]
MSGRRSIRAGDVREEVLAALRAARGPLGVAEIAADIDAPATTVRFHLRTLVTDGLADAEPVPGSGPGRPRLVYRPRRAMDPSGPRNYGILAEILVGALDGVPDGERHATEAGREWGARRSVPTKSVLDDMIAVLDEFGFAPEAACDGVLLRRCPFLELAQQRPQLTCSVHRGIIQGVLASHRTDLELTSLEAFVDGDHCLATLSRAAAPSRGDDS